jgi:hypothetical protein
MAMTIVETFRMRWLLVSSGLQLQFAPGLCCWWNFQRVPASYAKRRRAGEKVARGLA